MTDLQKKAQKLLMQGVKFIYYPYEAGADLNKQINDPTYHACSMKEAMEEIMYIRRENNPNPDSFFIWNLEDEL